MANFDSVKPHLLMRIAQGDFETVIQILQAGYPIDDPIESNQGTTIVMQAVIYGQQQILGWLLTEM